MKKKRRAQAAVLAMLSALALLPGTALASNHESDTDTGANRLDFIENRRRSIRENTPTQEQADLYRATQEMKEHLRHPVDATKAAPTSFEGDYLTYDQNTGEFIAEGKVHIVQMDGHQFDAVDGLVTGNTIKEEISVPGKAHMLQITPGQSTITLDGFKTFYRYGAQTGTMEAAEGKVDHQYVTGKKFEFYPDKIIIYDGTATKCNAKKPDYHTSGDKITIYPNDRMVIEHAKFWIKGFVLYSRNRYEQSLKPGEEKQTQYPRVGYSKDDGVWISQNFTVPFTDNVSGTAHLYADAKHGGRSRGTIDWNTPHNHYQIAYGYYEDGDENWIKRDPSFRYRYNNKISQASHLNYNFEVELGRWTKPVDDITSMHRYYKVGLSRDPILLGRKWFLFLGANYSITQETYNNSNIRGWGWDVSTVKEFDDRWAAYLAYSYSTSNRQKSLFDYDLSDYSRKGQVGFSYRIDDKNRFVLGLGYNFEGNLLEDVDYYWFHDMHCAQFIVRYHDKRKDSNGSWHVSWEFTPW